MFIWDSGMRVSLRSVDVQMAGRRCVSARQWCRTGENGRHQMQMGDGWRREWGLEMLMPMVARSIDRETELWRVCTWMIEG